MHWCNTVSLHHLSLPHSLITLGHRSESNSGMEPLPPPLTSDATPIKSKVAPRLTVSQGIDYRSTQYKILNTGKSPDIYDCKRSEWSLLANTQGRIQIRNGKISMYKLVIILEISHSVINDRAKIKWKHS